MYTYIYLPGLGNQKLLAWQAQAIKKWHSGKRQAVLIDPKWHDKNETYEDKFQRILHEVKNYIKDRDGKFCIVGSSAGGSMAIIIHQELMLEGAVLITGKLKTPNTIGPSYTNRAPALRQSVAHSQRVIEGLTNSRKNTVLTINPLIDEVISKNDRVITGVKNINLMIPGHVVSIGYVLLFGKNKIFKWFEGLSMY